MGKIIHRTEEYYSKRNAAIESKTKLCTTCGLEKNKSYFTTDKRRRDGKFPMCNECKKMYQRKLYKKQPERFYKSAMKWMKENKEKRKAHVKIKNVVASGAMVKPTRCEICGDETKKLDAHHWHGYKPANWLDVQWLCRPCHMAQEKV